MTQSEQRKVFGAEIKNMLEGQLIDPLIYYLQNRESAKRRRQQILM